MESLPQAHQPANRSEHPVPEIDPALCDGCGLCVRVCPEKALAVLDGLAFVCHPDACEYQGHCVRVCPRGAISRRFQIIFNPKEATTHESRFDP